MQVRPLLVCPAAFGKACGIPIQMGRYATDAVQQLHTGTENHKDYDFIPAELISDFRAIPSILVVPVCIGAFIARFAGVVGISIIGITCTVTVIVSIVLSVE